MSLCAFEFIAPVRDRFLYRCKKCQREVLSKYRDRAPKANCRVATQAEQAATPLSLPAFGPGTELTALFAELGIKPKASCGCKAKAAAMDGWGVAGCAGEHREEILTWMQEAYDTAGLLEKLAAGAAALSKGLPLTLAGLLDLALERARVKEKERMENALADLASKEPRSSVWRTQPEVIAAQRLLFDNAASAKHVMPGDFSGRGIVTLGGSAKYFGAACVLVYLLRRLGCQLPVEWWFLGWEEMDPKMVAIAESLGNVQCVNMMERLGKYGREPRRIGGWEAKPWAIMYSRFKEVLFLDSDQVPAADPSYLLDSREFQEAGTIAWPDYPPAGWSVTETAFRVARLPIPGKANKPDWRNPTDYRPWETGQLAVEKERAWHALETWAALSDQSDFWYPFEFRGNGAWHVYGDKDLAYLAWERTKTPYAMPTDCDYAGNHKIAGAFFQKDFAGNVLLQHRVSPVVKWRLHDHNDEVPGMVNHSICMEALADLRTKWVGHVWDHEDETAEERLEAEKYFGHSFWFREGKPVRLLFDTTRRLDGEHRWTVRKIHGEWMLVVSGVDKVAAFFGRDNFGNWCNHTKNQFIMPAPPEDFELPIEPDEIGIWNDVVNVNEYRLPESFDASDVILDIGGHCGMFAWACLHRGAGRVVSVEPAPENFARLSHNLLRFAGRSSRIPAAAWSHAGELQIEQKEGARHTGGWSAVGTKSGIRVPAISFEQLAESAACYNGQKTIRLVKLDCEGSEWPILESFTRWDLVEAWCGEYHNTPDDADGRIRKLFEPHGYTVIVEPHKVALGLGHFWARRPD